MSRQDREAGRGPLELPVPTSAVPFTAHRIEGTTTLWSNVESLEKLGFPAPDPKRVAEAFSYGIVGSPTFGSLRFDRSGTATLFAERYGGEGTGGNGGGARVGNFGPFQLKGIGRNLLAGETDGSLNGQFHNYGGLALADAISELVSSEILHTILPMGTVRCLAIIAIGSEAAVYPPRWDAIPGPAAILVRERCLRPAHFLPNGSFAVGADLLMRCGGDAHRVRRISHALRDHLGSHAAVADYFAEFLRRCAAQFSFARLGRVNHGALGAGNLAVDGRWLDTNWAATLPPGHDHAQRSWMIPFSGEKDFPKDLLFEWVYNYSKYAGAGMDPGALAADYDRSYRSALIANARSFYGLQNGVDASTVDGAPGEAIAFALEKAVSTGLRLSPALSAASRFEKDPVVSLLESAFGLAGADGSDAPVRSSLRWLLWEAWKSSPQSRVGYGHYERQALLRALRRAVYASFFYRDRIVGQSSAAALEPSASRLADLVRKWRNVASWVYGNDACDQILVQHGGIGVVHRQDGSVRVGVDGRGETFEGPDRFLRAAQILKSLPPECLRDEPGHAEPAVPPYDFRPGALAMLDALDRHLRIENDDLQAEP